MYKHRACCLPIAPIVDQAAQQCPLTHARARVRPKKHAACCSPIESNVDQAAQRFLAKINMSSPLHNSKDSSNSPASVMKTAISVLNRFITGVRASSLAGNRTESTVIYRHVSICIVQPYLSYIFTCWQPYRVTLSLECVQSQLQACVARHLQTRVLNHELQCVQSHSLQLTHGH